MTHRQKMLAGEMYDQFDPELVAPRAGNAGERLG